MHSSTGTDRVHEFYYIEILTSPQNFDGIEFMDFRKQQKEQKCNSIVNIYLCILFRHFAI